MELSQSYKIAFKQFQEEFSKENIIDNNDYQIIQKKEDLFKKFYKVWPQYIDPIILLIRFYRMNKNHEKASQWIKKIDNETEKSYDNLLYINEFIFERIFDEHIYRKNVLAGAKYAIQYLNMKGSCNTLFIYTNFYFFSHKIPGDTEWLIFKKCGIENEELHSSSMCFYPPENILCVRYVNYVYDDLLNSIPSMEKYISKNLIYWLGSDPETQKFVQENFWDNKTVATRCFGLEDIRLIQDSNGCCEFWATQQQWSGDGINRIVRGNLIFDTLLGNQPIFTNLQILEPPDNNCCEKNWIPFYGDGRGSQTLQIIYSWWPFQVGSLQADNKLQITYIQENLPEIFRYMRGSSCLIKYNSPINPNKFCCVTHLSLDPPDGKGLRRYFHFLVFLALKDEKLLITHFTEPFYFPDKNSLTHTIQYCIGFNIRPNGKNLYAQFWYSSMDNHSGFIECPMDFFETKKHSVIGYQN